MSRDVPERYSDLPGKTVVITGAGRGIGACVAQRFLGAGCSVVLIVRSKISWLPSVGGQDLEIISSDIRDFERVSNWLSAFEERGNSVDILANIAGVLDEGALLAFGETEWDHTFDVNVKATFRLCQLFAQHMSRYKGGVILNAASYAATLPSAFSGVYAASKAAIVSLTASMAAEWARLGIRVNAFSPGVIRTSMTEEKLALHQREMLSTISLNRIGQLDEVANVVLFLASDASSYITGSNIDVSGGKLIIQNPSAHWQV